jgi:hypothetical protein
MKPWSDQIDELAVHGKYSDALDLLNSLDDSMLADRVRCPPPQRTCGLVNHI